MGPRIYLAAALVFLASMACAQHTIAEPENQATPAQKPAPVAQHGSSVQAAPVQAAAPNVNVIFPSKRDIYLVQAATRRVCDTFTFGNGDVHTDCRTEPLPLPPEYPSLRGLCITGYGNRTCY